MSYLVDEAVRSLMSNFYRMGLSDKLLAIGVLMSYAGATGEELKVLSEYAVKARELETYMYIHSEMYRNGEIDSLPIPEELKEIYVAIMKYLGETLRKLKSVGI